MYAHQFVPLITLLSWLCVRYGSAAILPTFSWDPRNEMFHGKICGGDYAHIIVEEKSEMYFVCPSAVMITSIQEKFTSPLNMYENMYIVTKSEFDRCQVDGITQDTKKFLTCNTPKDNKIVKYRRIFFSPWAISDTVPFFTNVTYYFIATSNGSIGGLNNRKGGRCKSDNMKLAVTICEKGKDCNKHEHLCNTPKKKIPAVTTTTTTMATSTTTTTTTTKKTTLEPEVVGTPNAVPKTGDDDTSSKSNGGFGVLAVACLIGGLFVGLIVGFIAPIFIKRFTKKYRQSKSSKASSVDSAIDPLHLNGVPPKHIHEDNSAYRHSTEFKRLLSTSSNASSERYSTVPTVPVRTTPPPGTVAV